MSNVPLFTNPKYQEYKAVWDSIAESIAELKQGFAQDSEEIQKLEQLEQKLLLADDFLKKLIICFLYMSPLSVGQIEHEVTIDGEGPGPGTQCPTINSVAP